MPEEPPLSSSSEEHTLRVQQHFVRRQQAVLGYVLSLEPRLHDAQEIVQEVFLTVSRKAATWTEGTNFLAWACTIARYHTLDYQRKRARGAAQLDADVVDLVYAEVPEDAEAFERESAALRICLKHLAPRARELVRLRYHGGSTPEQIATRIGWTAASVRVALTRARTALRECLKGQLSLKESL